MCFWTTCMLYVSGRGKWMKETSSAKSPCHWVVVRQECQSMKKTCCLLLPICTTLWWSSSSHRPSHPSTTTPEPPTTPTKKKKKKTPALLSRKAQALTARRKSCTYAYFDHMAVQMTLYRCGVVLTDLSQVRMAPGPQPQRGPPDCDSSSPVARGGQSRGTDDSKFRIAHWNAEGVRQKKTELQNFLKQNGIDVCAIQEIHLTVNHRFYVRGYETYRQDQERRSMGGVLILVRNTIPSFEIQRTRASDTEFLGVELVLPDHHLQVFNISPLPLPPAKPIALLLIQPTTEKWIIMEDYNCHSPNWGYDDLDSKGERVECWATSQQLILINKPQDPLTFYSRSWRTTITHRLIGLVVKASASRAEDPGFDSRLRRDFSWSSHTSDLNIGTPVATLPDA